MPWPLQRRPLPRDRIHAYRPHGSATSFIQCRPTHSEAYTDLRIERLINLGFEELPLNDFYDILAVERKLIRRVCLRRASLELSVPGVMDINVAASLHVMFWSIGFAVFRVSLAPSGLSSVPGEGLDLGKLKLLHILEHELSEGVEATWKYNLNNGDTHTPKGNIRRFLDYFGFMVHEYSGGLRPTENNLLEWSNSFVAGQQHAADLVSRKQLKYTYPITFGSHSEFVWIDNMPARASEWVPVIMGEGEDSDGEPQEIGSRGKSTCWYLGEFQSVLIKSASLALGLSEFGSWDDNRLALVEYLAMRRGVLRTIQRETNRATAERIPLLRQQVADWLWLTSAVTDDYVLAGWQAARFERIKSSYGEARSLRSISELEAQVRRNIEAFQGRLDAESDRVGVVAAILFGIVAATALVPGMQAIVSLSFNLNGEFEKFPSDYPLIYIAVTFGLLLLMAATGWALMRRVRRLRPPADGFPKWRRGLGRRP